MYWPIASCRSHDSASCDSKFGEPDLDFFICSISWSTFSNKATEMSWYKNQVNMHVEAWHPPLAIGHLSIHAEPHLFFFSEFYLFYFTVVIDIPIFTYSRWRSWGRTWGPEFRRRFRRRVSRQVLTSPWSCWTYVLSPQPLKAV